MNQFAQTTGQPIADLTQGWQNSIATNCVLQLNPLAARSALCFFTSAANSGLGKC
jgi:hypothetical protein